jgi:hypothetical protein
MEWGIKPSYFPPAAITIFALSSDGQHCNFDADNIEMLLKIHAMGLHQKRHKQHLSSQCTDCSILFPLLKLEELK